MNNMENITKFERLPNEILIECFAYLNAIDILHSFDYLNYRFSNLIQDISLHLNIDRYVTHANVVQFCIKMSLNPQIKNQIISLKLSDKCSVRMIKTLLSFVTLHEFTQLQSLLLNDLDHDIRQQIVGMIPHLKNLRHLDCMEFCPVLASDEILPSILGSPSKPSLKWDVVSLDQLTSVTHFSCSFHRVRQLCWTFRCLPRLEYLNIKNIWNSYNGLTTEDLRSIEGFTFHLKHLIINKFRGSFDILEMLLQRTPNVKLLSISADRYEIMDADRWERLIRKSLHSLNIFKFDFEDKDRWKLPEFECYLASAHSKDVVVKRYRQFQTEFWLQHHWYTGYYLSSYTIHIYTIPCISHICELGSITKRFNNPLLDTRKVYKNIIDLEVYIESLIDTSQCYFPNLKSLKLDAIHNCFLKTKHIQYLKRIINLCNLTDLTISSRSRIKSSSVILHLLQETPNISSLKIPLDILFSLFDNNELCELFNRMIKKLDVSDYYSDDPFEYCKIKKLCQIFSNIVHFQCTVGYELDLILIFNELAKLPHIKCFSYIGCFHDETNRRFELRRPNPSSYSFTVECISESSYSYSFD